MGISSEPPLDPLLHQIVLLIAYLSREGSDAPAQSGSLTRIFAVHRHNVDEGLRQFLGTVATCWLHMYVKHARIQKVLPFF